MKLIRTIFYFLLGIAASLVIPVILEYFVPYVPKPDPWQPATKCAAEDTPFAPTDCYTNYASWLHITNRNG